MIATWALDSAGSHTHNVLEKLFKSYFFNSTAPSIPIIPLLNFCNEDKRKHRQVDAGAQAVLQIKINTSEIIFANLNPNEFLLQLKVHNGVLVSQIDSFFGFRSNRGRVMVKKVYFYAAL
jgi:hypothetical protein